MRVGPKSLFFAGVGIGIGMKEIINYLPKSESVSQFVPSAETIGMFMPVWFPYAFCAWFMGMLMITVTIFYYRWFFKKEG